MIICREQSETLSTNKSKFCNISEIHTLISNLVKLLVELCLFVFPQEDGPVGEAGTMICQEEFYTAHEDLGTMIINNSDVIDSNEGTVIIRSDSGTMMEPGTMIESGTMIENDMGTMVINDDDDEDDNSTMRSMFCDYCCYMKYASCLLRFKAG